MIFRCDTCSTACYCDAEAEDFNNWPVCHTCQQEMQPVEASV
jgi:hypothetical protein